MKKSNLYWDSDIITVKVIILDKIHKKCIMLDMKSYNIFPTQDHGTRGMDTHEKDPVEKVEIAKIERNILIQEINDGKADYFNADDIEYREDENDGFYIEEPVKGEYASIYSNRIYDSVFADAVKEELENRYPFGDAEDEDDDNDTENHRSNWLLRNSDTALLPILSKSLAKRAKARQAMEDYELDDEESYRGEYPDGMHITYRP